MTPVSDGDVDLSDRGGRGRRGGVLSLEDCCCPVCLEIFIEPVTLPCSHTFCKSCFLESVDKATLCCPMCRKRVSTWARQNSRNNTLVNQQLWTQIQTRFPLQCQRRLSGQDTGSEDDPAGSVFCPRVSEPGELRQEYEDQVSRLTEEKRALDEEERRASEEYIQRLLAEEEQLLAEERRRRAEDERLARMLSVQLNSAAVAQENPRPAEVTPAKKKKEVGAGQIEKFLCPRPSKSSPSDCRSASSFTANKENVLVSLQAEHLLPQFDLSRSESSDLHPTPLSDSVEEQLHLTTDGAPSSAKRKTSEWDNIEDKAVTHKRVCLPSSSSSSTSSSSVEVTLSLQQGIAEFETELLNRRKQEEEDRRLALLLQKELNEEEQRRATDRRKGSSDAYLLRQNRGKMEASSSGTPRNTPSPPSAPHGKTPKTSTSSSAPHLKTSKTSTSSSAPHLKTSKTSTSSSAPHLKTSKTSTPPSAPSSNRGSKQATLTEMFSTLTS